MPNPAQIMKTLEEKNRLLSTLNDQYRDYIEKKAQAEYSYNIAYAEKTMSLKMDGMQITLIGTLAKGDKAVAKLKLAMDVSEGMEKATLQAIKDARSAIDSLRSLLAWMKAELTAQ